jgi:hypothetical protein
MRGVASKRENDRKQITIGTQVNVQFLTAGLQGLDVGSIIGGTAPNGTLIGTVTIHEAANEVGNFSKQTDTTGVPAGYYWIMVWLKDQYNSIYCDWSDNLIELKQ